MSDMIVRAHLSWREGTDHDDQPSDDEQRRAGRRSWTWAGDAPADSVVRVGAVRLVTGGADDGRALALPTGGSGAVTLDLELCRVGPNGDEHVATNRYVSSFGPPEHR